MQIRKFYSKTSTGLCDSCGKRFGELFNLCSDRGQNNLYESVCRSCLLDILNKIHEVLPVSSIILSGGKEDRRRVIVQETPITLFIPYLSQPVSPWHRTVGDATLSVIYGATYKKTKETRQGCTVYAFFAENKPRWVNTDI